MSDKYLNSIANKYRLPDAIDWYTKRFVVDPLSSDVASWAGAYLNKITLSGSRSKGTAITLSSDLDLFISLGSDTTITLKEIFESLNSYLTRKGYKTRKQNVSVGVMTGGKKIDLVPAKKRAGNTNYHSLYLSKRETWTQTNIVKHIQIVKKSGLLSEIILLKIWRELNRLKFPSIYLELTVIEALKYKRRNDLANNFITVLQYLRDTFIEKLVFDPSNTNNKISDDLYKYEKEAIRKKAIESLSRTYWNQIVW